MDNGNKTKTRKRVEGRYLAGTGMRPRQKLKYKDKVKDDYAWCKDVVDYYAGTNNWKTDKEIKSLIEYYEYYNNQIPDRHFEYLTNPLSSEKDEHTKFPAKIREYTIIRPNIDLINGEYRKRPFVYQVQVNNPDAVSKKKDLEREEILKNLQALFAEEVDPQGREVETPEQIKKKYNMNYKDQRAIQGQYALDYIIDLLNVKSQIYKGFKDWTIAGMVFSYKGIDKGEIIYKNVNPKHCKWDETVDFIEDGEYFVWNIGDEYGGLTPSKIVDMFYEELTDEQIDDIDKMTYGNPDFQSFNTNIEVMHVVWKSFRLIKVITYIDPLSGEMLEKEVDEAFNEKKYMEETGIEIVDKEEYWVNEVWEGYRIGGVDGIYLRMRPIPYQFNTMANRSKCKLPYNGRLYSNRNAENISIIKLGIPFQILFIATMYNIEKLLNKNKGKIIIMDKNAIPNKGGWDTEKFMYYAEALGYMVVDRNQNGVDRSFNQYQVMDMSTIGQVSQLIGVLDAIQTLWDKTLGITPQRKGQGITSSSQVGSTERAVFQSSIISEEIYGRFDEYVQRELRGILDLSKFAWRDGKQAIYLGNDLRSIILDTDPYNYVSSDFGVTVSNSSADKDSMERMKELAQPFAQNGQSPTTILELVNSQNPSKLKEILRNAEEKTQEMMQQQQMGEQERIQQEAQVKENYAMLEHKMEMAIKEYERETQMMLEQMKLGANVTENPNDEYQNSVEQTKLQLEREKMLREDDRKRSEAEVKAMTEKYKADKQLEVAKENKNKYDFKPKKQ